MGKPRRPHTAWALVRGSFEDELLRLDTGRELDRDAWRELSRRAVARTPLARDPAGQEDLVQEALRKLWELRQRGDPQWRLARSMVEPKLRAWLRSFLRNLAADQDPRRKEAKALRPHVEAALREPIATVVPPPPSLKRGSTFSAEFVRAAVAWHRVVVPGRSLPAAVTRSLLELYDPPPGFEPLVDEEAAWLDLRVRRRFDGERLARRLLRRFTPSEAVALSLHLAERPLKVVAERLGVSVTTAHALVRRGQQIMEELVRPDESGATTRGRGTFESTLAWIRLADEAELRNAAGLPDGARRGGRSGAR